MELHGKVLGIPYDFRRPSWKKIKSHYWNPDDPRVFIPRAFGIGWDVNLYRVKERFPAVFYSAILLTVLAETVRCVVYLRKAIKDRGKAGQQ